MSDAPRPPPPKRDVALALLEESSMFIHLDPRRPSVLVPKGFQGQHQLVLQVGLNMAIPIPDLTIDEAGISCTLSFNRSPFWCRIPWSAIYALVGDDGRGGVWPEDVPPEIQQQKQGAAPRPAPGKRPKPKLAAVSSGDASRGTHPHGARLQSASSLKSEDAEAEDDAAAAAHAEASDPRQQPLPPPTRIGLAAVPPPNNARRPMSDASGALDTSMDESSGETSDTPALVPVPSAPAKSGAKKAKSEIPPYLRVIK